MHVLYHTKEINMVSWLVEFENFGLHQWMAHLKIIGHPIQFSCAPCFTFIHVIESLNQYYMFQ